MDQPTRNKELIRPLREAMYDFSEGSVKAALAEIISDDAKVHMCHPLGDMDGADLFDKAYAPLFAAVPDLERRDFIVVAGTDDAGSDWVGCGGHYWGTFVAPWLNIPPSGHLLHMRFHEFFRIENDKVVEIQVIWDIPEVMLQANAWPMAPSLGREGLVPGPATHDGIVAGPYNMAKAQASYVLIVDMLNHMTRHPSKGGPEVMELERFWHPKMNWYGPSGIGTTRGIAGFRNWHQIPFLSAMPDRGQHDADVTFHFFGDGDYAAVTGWPDMKQAIIGGGWMGIAPTGQTITLRSLDFWRLEAGKIRENWVLVDLLDVYNQLGVDVLGRMCEFNKARVPGSIPFPVGAA